MTARGSRTSHGLSLVEILTVLAIIAIMASVTVPMMWRMGAFSRERRTGAARELYAMLRAAKVYAASNRVDTALAYNYLEVPLVAEQAAVPKEFDGALGIWRRFLYQTITVREMTTEEKNRPGISLQGDAFVPLQNRSGIFRPMEEGTCAYLVDAPQVELENGLKKIYVYDPDGTPLYVDLSGVPVPLFAHVFKPSGRMRTDSAKQRYVLHVGLKPDANLDERFENPDSPTRDNEIRIPVELFAATGRVNVAD